MTTTLERLFDDYWEFVLRQNPTYATFLGDHRYDHLLPEYSEENVMHERAAIARFLERARAIPRESLAPERALDLDVFIYLLEDSQRGEPFDLHLTPINQLHGPHMLPLEILSTHPTDSRDGLESLLERYRAFPRLLRQVRELLDLGVHRRVVEPRVCIEAALSQIEAQAAQDPDASELLRPFRNLEGAADLRDEARRVIAEEIAPAYEQLAEFVRNHYLPACREEAGIWALPKGRAAYQWLAHHHTTTNLEPEEIHEIGLAEVAKTHREMEKVMQEVGFDGDLRSFGEHLRQDPRFYHDTGDAIIAEYRSILDRMNRRLPELFGHLPRIPYDLKPIEAYRAANAPDAYYYPPAVDGSRPGYFYVNTYAPHTRPRYNLEALGYHEAVPGHHLQIAIATELTHLPAFRRHGPFTAYVEGWALYAERLPKELGFYADPYSEFGRLTNEVWRSARLVVDTGIHHLGWTREEGIEYLEANTALSRPNIVAEVERYMVMPGQALSYKIGQMTILELREKAEKEIPSFDLRAFHDTVLTAGALPLDILRQQVNAWIESSKAPS